MLTKMDLKFKQMPNTVQSKDIDLKKLYMYRRKDNFFSILNKKRSLKLESTKLSQKGTCTETINWLKRNNFNHLVPLFKEHNGFEMINSSIEKLIQRCGPVQGKRLFYKIHKRKPSKLIYFALRNDNKYYYNTFWKPIIFTTFTIETLIKSLKQNFSINDKFACCLYAKKFDDEISIDNSYLNGISDKSMFFIDIQKDGKLDCCKILLSRFYS